MNRPVINWILWAFCAILVFIVAYWAIPVLFGLVDVTIPDKVVVALALLLAVGTWWGTRNL